MKAMAWDSYLSNLKIILKKLQCIRQNQTLMNLNPGTERDSPQEIQALNQVDIM